MKTIKASEFKAKCLRIISEVTDTGVPVIITRNGKPFCKLVSCSQKPESLFGLHRGIIMCHDDLIAPTGEIWDADR